MSANIIHALTRHCQTYQTVRHYYAKQNCTQGSDRFSRCSYKWHVILHGQRLIKGLFLAKMTENGHFIEDILGRLRCIQPDECGKVAIQGRLCVGFPYLHMVLDYSH